MKNLLLTVMLICFLTSCKNNNESSKVKDTVIEQEIVEEPNEESKPLKEESGKSVAELKAELISKGYEVFDYVDEKTKDTTLMQQYFIAFLKSGPIRNQNEEEANQLQSEHLAHLGKMYELGYADISGPFGDDGEIRGITIYNVPTLKMADSLANADPMVKAGRLVIEVHPWWAARGFSLR
ncbi:hypothetical protein BWZ20_08600 [Winogradskyella sp. J14-2]|uniref:YciI family protein n=1 Tax=Winogradskyella sp. J14-2 TaxID=1936080 RepID=UPI000972A8D2|nr:YciI family protein [Winogradskyella sp. J14-2]APY08353.1 hypothetical protein BWZ20_08600 [Winogradskyella sp. J14-2]